MELKVGFQQSAMEIEDRMAQSNIMQLTKKGTKEPWQVPYIQPQNLKTADKLRKTRTDDVQNRIHSQHSPDTGEMVREPTLPMNKVQRTPVSHRKKIILPGMQVSPSARGDGLKRGKTQLVNNMNRITMPNIDP